MFFGLEHFIPYFPSKVVYQQLFVVCWWCSRVHRPLFRRPCMAWMELSKLKSWVVDNGDPHIGSTFWSRRNVGVDVGVPFQAVHTLIDMGADCWQMNGSGFTALDYARDMETAEFLCALGGVSDEIFVGSVQSTIFHPFSGVVSAWKLESICKMLLDLLVQIWVPGLKVMRLLQVFGLWAPCNQLPQQTCAGLNVTSKM